MRDTLALEGWPVEQGLRCRTSWCQLTPEQTTDNAGTRPQGWKIWFRCARCAVSFVTKAIQEVIESDFSYVDLCVVAAHGFQRFQWSQVASWTGV
jgi:hypothetical protein